MWQQLVFSVKIVSDVALLVGHNNHHYFSIAVSAMRNSGTVCSVPWSFEWGKEVALIINFAKTF